MTIKGLLSGSLGQYKEAITWIDKALAIDKNNVYALVNKGWALSNLDQYKETITWIDEALALDKNNVYLLNVKGTALFKFERYDEAIEYFDKALQIKPNFIDGWNSKGECLNGFQRYKEAIDCFDKVLYISNDNVKLLNKALAFYNLKKYNKSVECYDKALDIDRDISQSLIGKGIILYEQENYSESIRFFQKVISNPNSYFESETIVINKAYLSRGQCEYQLYNYSAALIDFDKIDDERFLAQKSVNKGLCYFRLGLFEEAEKELRNAITYDSKLVEAYYNLAVIYTQENKYQKAITLLETCIKINRKSSIARDALKRLRISEQSDWYDWWFGVGRIKKVLGIVLIVSIFSLIILIAYPSFTQLSNSYLNNNLGNISNIPNSIGNATTIPTITIPTIPNSIGNATTIPTITNTENWTNANATPLIIIIIFLGVILILPSLKTVKLGQIELDTKPIDPKNIELEPTLISMSSIIAPFSILQKLEMIQY